MIFYVLERKKEEKEEGRRKKRREGLCFIHWMFKQGPPSRSGKTGTSGG